VRVALSFWMTPIVRRRRAMSNITKSQDKSIERRTGTSTLITNGQALIELEPDELRAVVGGRGKDPKVEVKVTKDGTITITVTPQ
jgi:hypothetical protein